jgi:GT2 family glycosyltransferase
MTPAEIRAEYEREQARSAWDRAESATDPDEARTWLERAHRFVPGDQNIAFALALARLTTGDNAASLDLFRIIAQRHATRDVCCGIAAAALALGEIAEAADAIGRALATAAPNETVTGLAGRIAAAACMAGWAGLQDDGRPLFAAPGPVRFRIDGRPVRLSAGGTLPDAWRHAGFLSVEAGGLPLLGSPIDIAAILRTEGVVELTKGGLEGWAWHPGAPETDPVLHVVTASGTTELVARDLSVSFRGTAPLARPRGFRLAVDTAASVRVLGRDRRDLLGSPLGGPTAALRAPRPRSAAGTAVIVPAYRGKETTLACLESVLATLGPDDSVLVVNDASPEPDLAAALQALARAGRIRLLPSCAEDPARNLGFPAAANAGLRATGGRDAVLLNSDTLVFPGWLEALHAAAHSAPDIGTATPFSNDATIFTYPDPASPTPMPAPDEAAALARLAARINGKTIVDVPTGHGFCLYIRADCLHRTGLLRPQLFAQGYGEENDFTERARHLGWRHVAVPGAFVAHVGGTSFGTARDHLLRRNGEILNRLHPEYRERVAAFIAADPLFPARRRLDAARWQAAARARQNGSVLLIAHGGIGGTARVVRERVAAIRDAGRQPVILRGQDGSTTVDAADGFSNLRFDLPAELPALARLLASARPEAAEIHHLRDQDFSVLGLLDRFSIPYDVWVHDYMWLCPRLSLVTGDGRFCGEPPPAVCGPCVAQWGDGLERPISAESLRAMSAGLLAGARRVVTPSADVAARIRRHFPAAPVSIEPWESDPPPRSARTVPGGLLTVAVIGAIGLEKGYLVLLDCARDAAARTLPLHFHVVGYTENDTPLLETGHVTITGPFQPGEAGALIAVSTAQIAFLPSVWPETWCYALSDAWNAGLDAAVFDIGTPADRVRRTGRGWVLPLSLPAPRVNDALLKLQALAGRSAG